MTRSTILLLVAVLLGGGSAIAQPRAAVLHAPPDGGRSGEAIELEAEISGWELFQRVVVRFRGPGDEYREATLELQYGDLFRGELPAEVVQPPGVEYFLEGVASNGKRTALFESHRRPYRVRVTGVTASRPTAAPAPPEPARIQRALDDGSSDDADAAFDAEPPPAAPARDARPTELEMPPPPSPAASRGPSTSRSDNRPSPSRDERGRSGSTSEPSDERGVERASAAPERITTVSGPSRELRRRSELEDELSVFAAEDPALLGLQRDEERAREPSFVTRFGSERLRTLGVRYVHDVLDLVPGLTVSRDVQGFHRVGVRGLRSEPEVLFLLDGQRLNNFFDGRALANLPIDNLEALEVHRGPGAARFGAGAFLAVVNLVTRKDAGVRASASGGSFDAFDGHLNAAGAMGGISLSADADVVSQHGFSRDIARDALDRDTINQGLRAANERAGQTSDRRLFVNAGGRASYGDASVWTAALAARVLYEDRSALVGLFDSVGGPNSRLGWLTLLTDARLERPVGDGLRFFANLGVDHQRTDRLFQLTPAGFATGGSPDQVFPDGLREQTKVGVTSFALDVGADARLAERNRLYTGVRVERQDLSDYSLATNFTADDRFLGELQRPAGLTFPQERDGRATSRLAFAAYAEDRWTPFDALILDLGLRFDAIQLPDRDGPGTAFVPSLNPRAAASFVVAEPFVLKLQYARAFRAPTVQELTESVAASGFNQGRFQGNPLLRPSIVDQLDWGGEWVDLSAGARIHLRVNGFLQHLTDPIVSVDSSGNISPISNRAGVRVFGVEGEGRVSLTSRAAFWANASFFRAEDLEDGAPSLLTDVPQARFNAGFSLPLGRWLNLDAQFRYGAERRNNIRSVLEQIRPYRIPAYALVTTQLRTERIAEHFELAVLASNVFDQQLVDDAPRPDRMPGLIPREGRQAFVTVRAFY